MKKTIIVLSVFALSFISACGQNDSDNHSHNGKSKIDYKINHQAALLRALPSKAVAYARVPSLAGMLTTPQADRLYPAITNQTIHTQSTSILEGIDKNLLSKIEEPQARELARLFLNKQIAPIEVAVLAGSIGSISPELLLQTKINFNDIAELTSLLEQIIAASQNQLQLTQEPDANGNFKIAAGPVNIYGYFDLKSKDLVIYGGPTAIQSNLTAYRDGSLEKRDDLREFEAKFDSAGTGLSLWVDASQLWKDLSPMIPAEISPQLNQLNLKDTKFVYFGTASKAGHSSMRLHLEYKGGGDNLFHFPTSKPVLDAQVALPLSFTASMPMLNQQHLEQFIKLDNQFNPSPSLSNKVSEASQFLKDEYQLDLNQLLTAFGGNGIFVGDKAGTWASLPIQNNEAFDTLIKVSQEKLGATLIKSNVSGLEIEHFTFPSLSKMAIEMADDKIAKGNGTEALKQLLSGENIHVYWVRDGANLIMASLPQTLIARERHKSSTTARQWIESRGMDRNESILSFTAHADNLPRTAYHMYLSGIQSLSDVAGVQPNLTALPLAEDLGLADSGRVGIALNTGKTSTSLILNYEQTPLDYLSGGNMMASVAVIGILAAVALPAYEDYTIRAKSAEALVLAGRLKVQLSEYYSANGDFPTVKNEDEFSLENEFANVYYDANEQLIIIIYASEMNYRLADTELNLIPSVSEDGYIDWLCSNVSAPDKLIPVSCRN